MSTVISIFFFSLLMKNIILNAVLKKRVSRTTMVNPLGLACQKFGKCLTWFCWHVTLPPLQTREFSLSHLPHSKQENSLSLLPLVTRPLWTMALGSSTVARPEVETQASTSVLVPLLPFKKATMHHSPRCAMWYTFGNGTIASMAHRSPKSAIHRSFSGDGYRPLWPTQGCTRNHEAFVLEVPSENALLRCLQLLKTMQKHTPFSWVYQRPRRLCESIALLYNFWRVHRSHESTHHSCVAFAVSENCMLSRIY